MIGSHARSWAGATLLAFLALAGCAARVEEKHVVNEPLTIDKAADGGLQLTLTARAAERIGIETVTVEEAGGRRVVPSGAVIVAADGKRFVYVNPERLVFTREPVVVEVENEGRAWLAEGPPAGTRVVTYGAAELFGAETGIK
ncbi:MAG: hypothetical protein ACRDJ4_12100 [Actinomycetota bacterium]